MRTAGAALACVALLAAVLLVSGQEYDPSSPQRYFQRRARNFTQRGSPFTSEARPGAEARQARIRQSLDRLEALMQELGAAMPSSRHDASADGASLLEMAAEARAAGKARARADAQFIGGLLQSAAGAAASLLFSGDEQCVMCCYVLEQMDRQVKSLPHWANGGASHFAGNVDFSAGSQQAFYRSSPQFLQLDDSRAGSDASDRASSDDSDAAALLQVGGVVGSGVPERAPAAQQVVADDAAAPAAEAAPVTASVRAAPTPGLHKLPAALRAQLTGRAVSEAQPAESAEADAFTVAEQLAAESVEEAAGDSEQDMEVDGDDMRMASMRMEGQPQTPPTPRHQGRHTFRDRSRVGTLGEKDAEFDLMFNDLMAALDDICTKDLPKQYMQYCRLPYRNGDLLTELYVHNYQDWEICTKIAACGSSFFAKG